MPAGADEDAIIAVLFEAEFGTNLKGAFMEAKGFGSSSQVTDHKQTNSKGKMSIMKLPGTITWTDITLTQGLTTDMNLWKWFKMVQDGKMAEARVNGTITVFNEKGEAKAKFEFTNAWPCAITGPSLGADSTEIGIEEITITHEGYKRVAV